MKLSLKPIVAFLMMLGMGAGAFGLVEFFKSDSMSLSAGDSLIAQLPSFGSSTRDTGRDPFNLRVLEKVAYFIEEDYVDPSRVKPKEMVISALGFLQRRIPEFRIESQTNDKVVIRVGKVLREFELGETPDIDSVVSVLKKIFDFLREPLGSTDDPQRIEYAAISGLLKTLDPHSVLLPPETYEEMKLSTSGEFGGLGIVISIRDHLLTVIAPIDGTPASNAGIKAGDKVISINGESTINMSLEEAVKKLRGPKGTAVTISVRRKGLGAPREFTIVRDIIKVINVSSQLLTKNVGYIRIRQFQGNTRKDLEKHLSEIRKKSVQPLKGLILDLRDNPGGLLEEAISVSDKFLSSGAIVTTVGVGNKLREQKNARRYGTEGDLPLVVLINQGSASASEIVAGAIKNRDRGVLIGRQSFGKGSVQNLFDLRDGSALKLTIAKYLTPGDQSIQSVGITPDIEVLPLKIGSDWVDLSGGARHFRERDLDLHFENAAGELIKRELPSHNLFFVEKIEKKKDDPEAVTSEYNETPDPQKDFEIRFARDLLVATSTSSRPAMLKQAQAIIKKEASAQDLVAVAAFKGLGLDWSNGPTPAKVNLQIGMEMDPKGDLAAGSEVKMKVKVKNLGEQDLYRIHAVSKSDNDIFDGVEFVFGHLSPGQASSWTVPVTIPKSHPAAGEEITIEVASSDSSVVLSSRKSNVVVRPMPRPVFAYTLQVVDSVEEGGNGDGLPQPGEMVQFRVQVKNIGLGVAEEPVASLKNLSGEDIYVERGRFRLESMAPGEVRTALFDLLVQKTLEEDHVKFRVTIADMAAGAGLSDKIELPTVSANAGEEKVKKGFGYARVISDRASVQGGASEKVPVIGYLSKGDTTPVLRTRGPWVAVKLDENLVGWIKDSDVKFTSRAGKGRGQKRFIAALKSAPQLYISEPLGELLVHEKEEVQVTGIVSDDIEVKDLYILVNDKKVFYQVFEPGKGVGKLRFTTKIRLEAGSNRVFVVARDFTDLASSTGFSLMRIPKESNKGSGKTGERAAASGR